LRASRDGSPAGANVPLRKWLALAAILLMAAGAFEPFYIRALFSDRQQLRTQLDALRYRKAPLLQPVLNAAKRLVPRGSAVALMTPYRRWDGGYEYCFSHAAYELPGRRVLPLIDDRDAAHAESLSEARFVIAYGVGGLAGFRPIWSSPGGSLLARIR
jgi:hypothetical protein